MTEPEIKSVYRHFKGFHYEILGCQKAETSYFDGQVIEGAIVDVIVASNIKKGDRYVRYGKNGALIEYWRSLENFSGSVFHNGLTTERFLKVKQ